MFQKKHADFLNKQSVTLFISFRPFFRSQITSDVALETYW